MNRVKELYAERVEKNHESELSNGFEQAIIAVPNHIHSRCGLVVSTR